MPCSCKNDTRRKFIQNYIEDLNKLWETKPPVRGATFYKDEGRAYMEFED